MATIVPCHLRQLLRACRSEVDDPVIEPHVLRAKMSLVQDSITSVKPTFLGSPRQALALALLYPPFIAQDVV